MDELTLLKNVLDTIEPPADATVQAARTRLAQHIHAAEHPVAQLPQTPAAATRRSPFRLPLVRPRPTDSGVVQIEGPVGYAKTADSSAPTGVALGESPERGRRPVRRKHAMVLVGAATAAVAVGVAVVASGGSGTGRAPVTENGRTVLLTAAETAVQAPPTSGKYWDVSTDYSMTVDAGKHHQVIHQRTETWTNRAGASAMRSTSLAGGHAGQTTTVPLKGTDGFLVCDTWMSYRQVQALPTDPTRLEAALHANILHNDDGPVPTNEQPQFLDGCLVELLSEVPAPNAVRAAAYRLLAQAPDVKLTGKTTDPTGRPGLGIRLAPAPQGGLTGVVTLVFDPKTATILSDSQHVTGYQSFGPHTYIRSTVQRIFLATGWTNSAPRV